MAKFSGNQRSPVRSNLRSPVKTSGDSVTFEGGKAYSRTPESDLFLLAATNMVGEDTFYESATVRDDRFLKLVRQVATTNPDFIRGSDPAAGKIGLGEYLRRELLMRSASIVLAAEYVAAGGPEGRSLIARSLQRPDEPAEMIGYWLSAHGRNIPVAIKRGIADAVLRMYTEKNLLKYDGQARNIRFADVIELTHPKPKTPRQSALFRYALDRRHHEPQSIETYGSTEDGPYLSVLAKDAALLAIPEKDRRSYLRTHPEALEEAGWTWERLSGWLPGGMDAEAWQSILPTMGVMALVRNLRNFDQAGISEEAIDIVTSRIVDPAEVAKARLFPYQVWSAYKNAPSDNWRRPLGKTLDLTSQNIPRELSGTLVLIDVSGSMGATVSGKSQMQRWEVAAVMAAAVAKGTSDCDVVAFGTDNQKLSIPAGTSALGIVNAVQQILHRAHLGYGTNGHTALAHHWDPASHKRAVIFTDDQMHDSGRYNLDHVPTLYTFNLGGYAASSFKAGEKGRHTLGGFSDATFTLMKVLEMGRNADWPF